ITSGGPPPEPPPGHELLIERLEAYPRRRTYLLPALTDVQHELGWLPDWAIQVVGAHLRVPKSEAYGIASSFPELRLTELPVHRLRVCTGASCRVLGADGLVRDAAALDAALETTDCLFIC